MKIALINGSPKAKDSNSEYFLGILKDKLGKEHEYIEYKGGRRYISEEEIKSVLGCEAVVLAFPLYVDGIPSHLLCSLQDIERISSEVKSSVKIYAVLNCGFIEGGQNRTAIRILKNWCLRAGLLWGQAIACGGGEMMGSIKNIPLEHGPNKSLNNALNVLSENILRLKDGEDLMFSPSYVPKISFLFAGGFWNGMAKQNGLKKRDLFKRMV